MDQPDVSLTNHPLPPFEPDVIVSSVISKQDEVREMLSNQCPAEASGSDSAVPLHRISAVRNDQGISLTRVSKKLSIDISEARRQEQETTDLCLSQLYRWRNVLQVPVSELIIEPDEIPSNPIKNRCQLIKMMKTVRAIHESSKEKGITILAQLLADQLIELMPELKSVPAWPSVGQSREQRDLGQAAYRHFDASISRKLDE